MPPRLRLPGTLELPFPCLLTPCSSLPTRARTSSPLELALRTCPHAASSSPSSPSSPRRSFSTTRPRSSTLPSSRYAFYRWCKMEGHKYIKPRRNRTNYIGDMDDDSLVPFPSNPYFVSQPVLSDASRDLIHKRVAVDEEPLMVVSADLSVDHRRVAAVVRMKEIEHEWKRTGKKLAKPYAAAVAGMLPQHNCFVTKETDEDGDTAEVPTGPYEPINEIHVHGLTMQQLFVPTSESRHFTRADAAAAFHRRMLPADARMPHKDLVRFHRRVQREGVAPEAARALFVEDARDAERRDILRDLDRQAREKKVTLAVPTPRAEFRFKRVVVDDVGHDGRSRKGAGWRYGAPYEDRKKDQVKHPTKYE